MSAATATNSTNAAEFMAAILTNPAQPPLPSTMPALSDHQVDQLATALVQIDLPADKYGILWVLAFSQNERAFDVLRYVLIGKYSGRSVRSVGNAALQKVTKLVGMLARTSDRAWQFLVDLTRPEGWGRLNLWSEDYLTETYDSEELSKAEVNSGFQTSIISAMAVSGRPEFRKWAGSLMRSEIGPDDFTKPAVSAIAYGVFMSSHIAEHGVATFDDDVLYNVRGGTHCLRSLGADRGGPNLVELVAGARGGVECHQSNGQSGIPLPIITRELGACKWR